MKKLAGILCLLFIYFLSGCGSSQKPDLDYDVSVKEAAFKNNGPHVLFDEAHNNFHKASGTYEPFLNLVKNDGYTVEINRDPFTYDKLLKFNILVISNAKGGDKKYDPAFTEKECSSVSKWINEGGSLLLIADHYPFGGAAEILSEKFGVHMSNGETGDSVFFQGSSVYKDELVFSRNNGLLSLMLL